MTRWLRHPMPYLAFLALVLLSSGRPPASAFSNAPCDPVAQ